MLSIKRPIVSILLFVFGLITLYLSSALIFDLFGERAKQGNFVPVVVWGNLICSILYIGTAISIQFNVETGKKMLWTGVVVLVFTAIIFTYQILTGTIYETKTIFALLFRILVTGGFIYALNKK